MATTCSCCGETATDAVSLLCHPDISICSRCLDWLSGQRDRQERSHGGWRVAGFEPIFTVSDLARSTDHYERMGFEISHHDEGDAFAHRDRDLTIHLSAGGSRPAASALYLHCHDADQIADEWRMAGLEVDGPHDHDDGKREGTHVDPDGNLIRFGSPLRTG